MRFLIIAFLLLSASTAFALEFVIHERSGVDRIEEPVTGGVPLPQGWASSLSSLSAVSGGAQLPCQFSEAARWPDGSLKWVHLNLVTSLEANTRLYLDLRNSGSNSFQSQISVNETEESLTVETGRIKAVVRRSGFNLIDRLWLTESGENVSQLIDTHDRGLVMWAGGQEFVSALDAATTVEVESSGPVRVVLKAEGDLANSSGGGQGFHYVCRLYFHGGSSVVRVAFSFENRGPYLEGREDKVALAGLHLEIPFSGTATSVAAGLPGGAGDDFRPVGQGARVLCPSSTELSYSIDGLAAGSTSPKSVKSDQIGWLAAGLNPDGEGAALGISVKYFWEMHPSSLELDVSGSTISAGLYPGSTSKTLDIYSGVGRTFYLRLAFVPGSRREDIGKMLAGEQKPLLILAEPDYYCRDSGVFGKLNERNTSLYPPEYAEEVRRVEAELDLGLEMQLVRVESRTKNGVTQESYGLLNWGDGMHYAWESGVQEPRNIAWNHHYYDLPHMCFLEFIRTLDYRWLDYYLSRAHHMMDVHMVHLGPGARLDGAGRYCPPTDHVRNDPGNSSYSSARVYISPYTNHHKVQGLFERWYLAGDERARDVALRGVEFANGFGGYADFKQPRGAAFQVFTLLAGYESTGDETYLNTAKQTFELWYNHFQANSTKFTQGYFMVGFLLEAFIDLYGYTGDIRTESFVQQAVDWMRSNESVWFSPGGHGKYSNMAFGQGWLAVQAQKPAYSDLQLEYLGYWKGVWGNTFKDFGLAGRSVGRSLYFLSYEGLGLEIPEQNVPLKGDYDQDGQLSPADVVSLIVKGIEDPFDVAVDYNRDGKFSILDVVGLILQLRKQ